MFLVVFRVMERPDSERSELCWQYRIGFYNASLSLFAEHDMFSQLGFIITCSGAYGRKRWYIYHAIRNKNMAGVVCDLGVAARAVHNGKILLVKEARGSYQNLWGLPKGSVDEGESPESAVLRELTEETALVGRLWGYRSQINSLQGKTSSVSLL